jgi:hypothetical protein
MGAVFLWSIVCMSMVVATNAHAQALQNAVQIENAKPGTSEWRLTNPDYATGKIEGYASLTSVNRGGQIKFYVNTVDPMYTLEIFRMGWYQGLRGRRMTAPVTLPGIKQAIPMPDASNGNLIECNWANAYVLSIPATVDQTDWMSGFYYVKLTGSSGFQQYIHFVLRDDARHSDFLLPEAVTTAQAYNPWAGKSLYGTLANRGDTTNASRKVSFDRPYYGDETWGAGNFSENNDFKYYEWGMVGFLEQNGYDVTYATNIDVDSDPNLLLSHKAFLSVGHDEYWSRNMRTNVEHARDAGINLGFFSANTAYWQVRFENSVALNEPARVMVGYKDYCAQDPITPDYLKTCRFRELRVEPINYSEDRMMGVMYITQSRQPFIVEDESSWVLSGTGLKNGDSLVRPGTPDPNNPTKLFFVGYEVDAVGSNSPANVQRIGHSPATNSHANYSDMVVYRASSGATVFASGSITWTYEVPQIVQVTKNVLARLSTGAFADTTPIRPALPQPFQSQDIGPVGRAGFVSRAGTDNFILNGDGQDSFSGKDAGFYAYQTWTGDGQITVRIPSIQAGWDTRAGVMVRETLDPTSKYVSLLGRPSDSVKGNNPSAVNEGAEFKAKDVTGSSPKKIGEVDLIQNDMADWLKIVRIGNTFYSFASLDGTNWNAVGSTTVVMNTNVYIGAWVASAEHNVWKTAEYDHVSVSNDTTLPVAPPADTTAPTVSITSPANNAAVAGTVNVSVSAADNIGVASVSLLVDGVNVGTDTTSPYAFALDSRSLTNGSHTLSAVAKDAAGNSATSATVTMNVNNTTTQPSLPSGWSNSDIGAVGPAGSSNYNSTTSTFTIKGAGADVWNTADAFQYAYTTLNGDGKIIARVTSVSTEAAWVKVGVMIRETLDPASKQGFMLVSNTKGLAFQRRTATSGISTSTTGGSFTAPRWVRLDRTGSTLAAYQSADGTNWTLVDTDTISMASNIYVGLAVSSHTAAAAATGVVDNVSIIPGATPPPDTTPPTVSITSPVNSANVSGAMTVNVNATDNVGVSSVQLIVDGFLYGSADTTAPYSFGVDTTALSNGSHKLMAIAHDAESNTGASAEVIITVNNTPPASGTCSSVVVSPSTQFSGAGAPGTVAATWTFSATASSVGCAFTAKTDAAWLELKNNDLNAAPADKTYVHQQDVSFTSSSGPSQIKVHTLANTTGVRRVAHVLIGGVVVITITQE